VKQAVFFNNVFSGADHMTSTLAGVFDDYEDAERAREQLAQAGFRREAIQVTPERSAWGSGDATYGGRAKERGGLRAYFAELFGIGEPSHEDYSEAVRRGSIVVAVEVDDDSQIERARDILEDGGAIDVDERVERWKAAGYTGYDEQAKPLTTDEIARDRDTLQVVQEELKLGKHAVQRGVVRVHQRVVETPVQEQVEEVDVRKLANQRTETVTDTVRRTNVDVERTDAGGAAGKAQPQRAGRYTGVERRKQYGNYSGAERRATR